MGGIDIMGLCTRVFRDVSLLCVGERILMSSQINVTHFTTSLRSNASHVTLSLLSIRNCCNSAVSIYLSFEDEELTLIVCFGSKIKLNICCKFNHNSFSYVA